MEREREQSKKAASFITKFNDLANTNNLYDKQV